MKVLGETNEHMTKGLPMFEQTKSMAFAANAADPVAENVQLFMNNAWRS